MNREPKDNSGVLFKNDRKEGEKDRDYQGSIRIAGRDYWLSAWINESQKGTRYMSLSVKPKDAPRQQSRRAPEQPKADEFDDAIPFALAAALPTGMTVFALLHGTSAWMT